jgi:hypothetical protein
MSLTVLLKMEPSTPPMSWKAFRRMSPENSIAIDGYVAEAPDRDDIGRKINFNHHEGVDRMATRATCAQIRLAIRMGLYDWFKDGIPVSVYANDCDEDVCLTLWLLQNHTQVVENPMLNRLLHLEDILDTTAGCYPFHKDLGALEELAWIFDPYRRFRISGGLGRRSADEFTAITVDVGNRISRYIAGRGDTIPLDTQYNRIRTGSGWALVQEVGANGRVGVLSDGIVAFVSYLGAIGDRHRYVIGRSSPFISFPLETLYSELNRAEDGKDKLDLWGGSDTIGGCPRVSGSSLDPEALFHIVEECVQKYKQS